YERSLHCDSSLVFEDIFRIIAQDVVLVGQRFGNTLDACESRQLSVDGSELGPRLSAAANYFRQRLQREVQVSLDNLRPLTDNKAVRKKVSEALREVRLAVFVQLRLLDVIPAETAGTPTPVKFSTEAYCRARTLAELDFGRKAIQRGGARESALPVNVQRPGLYRELVSWRLALARELEIGAYRIAPNDALKGIAAGLPTSKTELLNVNKIGPKTCEQYGEAMLGIVQNYLKREQLREAAVG
ncbi:MAG: HRDC domain-containing protein, partial [Bacteroidota bacterium]